MITSRTFADPLPIPLTGGSVQGAVELPGSKSLTNRALLLGSLARGRTVLRNASTGDDCRRLLLALSRLGIRVDDISGDGRVLVLEGRNGSLGPCRGRLHAGEGGTTSRFLLAALILGRGTYTLDGGPRLRERPLSGLVRALSALGAQIRQPEDGAALPLTMRPPRRPAPGAVAVDVRKSSQFASALMMAGACFDRGLELVFQGGPPASHPYLEMTAGLMQFFGARVEVRPFSGVNVGGGSPYLGQELFIEGDASGASYFMAAAAISGGTVRCTNLDPLRSLQGDARFAELLRRMGCDVQRGPGWVQVSGSASLAPLEIDMNRMPDMVPTMAVTALFAAGRTRIRNVAHLRWKESNRLDDLARELRRLGGRVQVYRDGLGIEGRSGDGLRGAEVETYRDHRMAMSLALTGLRVAGVTVRDPCCTGKSYPGYFSELFRLAGGGEPGTGAASGGPAAVSSRS